MEYIKKSIKYVITFICMIVVFFLALYLTSLIPRELIYEKIFESAEILNTEGGSFYYNINSRDIQIDNYTDAIMLNNIYSIDNNNIIESIIKCRRNYDSSVTTKICGEKAGNLLNEDGSYNVLQDLSDITRGKDIISYEYARYWHGYMSILRPMLIFFNVAQIRVIFEIILCISLFILSFYLYKNVNKILAILTFLTFLSIDILSFIKNLQGMLVIIIAVITSIFIVSKKVNKKNINIVLFIVGGLTAYFDLLSTPLITILLPIIMYFIVNEEENLNLIFKQSILMCLVWGIGYIGIWFSKWVINDCLYNSGLILLSLEQILFRINSSEIVGTNNIAIKAIQHNIFNSVNWVSISILEISLFYIIKNFSKCFKKYKIIYIIIAIIPILWYLIIANHSCQHHFFTYKLLIVTLFAIVCIAFDTKIEEHKQKLIIIAIIILLICNFFIFNSLMYLNSKKVYDTNYENIEELNYAVKESDEKITEEKNVYEELIEKEYENQKYDEPYIFEGFSYVEGTWENGYVIQDENGNQYVWVPCTNKIINDCRKLQRTNETAIPFINYTSCYNESYEKFLKSALENGGFYISRYEIGNVEGKPVSKVNVEVLTNITRQEAKDIVSKMYTNINCEIINGYAYDTTLKWIEDYSNKKINGNKLEIKKDEKIFTGREVNNNIYDFCDNVLEYSLENLYDTIIVRGFIYSNITEDEFTKESRYCMQIQDSSFGGVTPVAIRTVLYK